MLGVKPLRQGLFTALVLSCSLDERELRPGPSEPGAEASGGACADADGGDSGTAAGGDSQAPVAGRVGGANRPPECGDGAIEGSEQCDDGGARNHDGCDATCAVEPGYECEGVPSSCITCVGASGERRCLVAGGSFERGEGDEKVSARVASFWLDELEVTVRRFRPFVTELAAPPTTGAGANPRVAESGWRDEWSERLPATPEARAGALLCNHDWQTWTPDPGEREDFPITCASYYLAFAFCVTQSGRLPTEAEWEYTAVGGGQQRTYPWGDSEPNAELAQFGSLSASAVGSHASGRARFGQQDLAGSVWEWTLDYFAPYPRSCQNCAEVEDGSERVLRGGDWLGDATYLNAGYRFQADPAATLANVGFRCAYDS